MRDEMVKIFGYTDKDLYEMALKTGEKRFSSPCKHKNIKRGRCTNCLRKVIAK